MPGPYALPVGNARISNSFDQHNARRPRPNNPGTDFAVPSGTVAVAPEDATVIRVDMNPNSQIGRNITLRHDDGAETMFFHLERALVRAGQRIGRSQNFAITDNSGTATTGAHLHVSLWYQGRVLDFMRYVGPRPIPAYVPPAGTSIRGEKVYIARVSQGKTQGVFLITPQAEGRPTALGLAANANYSGFPVVEINQFADSFWATVRLV